MGERDPQVRDRGFIADALEVFRDTRRIRDMKAGPGPTVTTSLTAAEVG